MTGGWTVIIERAAVLEAEEAIVKLIARLDGPDPVGAEGMALLERILTNAARSPLYNPSEPGTLRRMMRVATDALETNVGPSREFELAA